MPVWRFPVLAQRAVVDSPRWTRARWEPARPPFRCHEEKKFLWLVRDVNLELDQANREKQDVPADSLSNCAIRSANSLEALMLAMV